MRFIYFKMVFLDTIKFHMFSITCDALERGVMICAPTHTKKFVMPKMQNLQQASALCTLICF